MSGGAMLLVARIANVVCAYSTLLVLTRLLTVDDFGLFVVVNAIASVLNTVVGTGFNQSTSRAVAAALPQTVTVRARILRHAGVSALLLSVLLAAGAPLAALALDDDRTQSLLFIVALSPGLYALFGVHAGTLNGVGSFGRQGSLATFLSVARLLAMGGAAAIGLKVSGVIWGSLLAAVATIGLSFVLVKPVLRARQQSPEGASEKVGLVETLRQVFAFSGAAFFLQMVMTADLLLLKRLSDAADSSPTAHYAAAQSIGRLVFFLFLAVSQMTFPKIARGLAASSTLESSGESDALATNAHRAAAAVFSLLTIALLGVVALSTPLRVGILGFLFPPAYVGGERALLWLLPAAGLLSLTEATLAMVSAATGARRAAVVLGAAWVIQVAFAIAWIGTGGVEGAAQATCLASGAALVGAVLFARVHVRLSIHVGPVVLGAVLAAGATWGAWTVSQAMPSSPLAWFAAGPGLCVFLVTAYAAYVVAPLAWLWRNVKREAEESQ